LSIELNIGCRCNMTLERAHERDDVTLLSARELQSEHQVEELDRVVERQQAVVVQVRRRVLEICTRGWRYSEMDRCSSMQATDAYARRRTVSYYCFATVYGTLMAHRNGSKEIFIPGVRPGASFPRQHLRCPS
jgi:hypothetical protein